jgi:hypothetical protein
MPCCKYGGGVNQRKRVGMTYLPTMDVKNVNRCFRHLLITQIYTQLLITISLNNNNMSSNIIGYLKQVFYNTTNLSGNDLSESVADAQKQQKLVETFFRKYPNQKFTPFEVHKALNINAPITSIRRAITNLTNEGILVKTDEKRIGQYGKPNYTWTLKQ